jgi:hypothetical protein
MLMAEADGSNDKRASVSAILKLQVGSSSVSWRDSENLAQKLSIEVEFLNSAVLTVGNIEDVVLIYRERMRLE